MQRATLLKIGKRVIQIGLPIVVVALFLRYISGVWHDLTAHTFHWDPWLLALAFFGFVLQELSYGLIWRAVLIRLGHRLKLRVTLRIYLASEFVRYIPGNVWHVLTRILWVSKYGVSRPVAFASMTVELITKLAAGVLIFAASLLFWHDISAVGSLLHGSLVMIVGIATIVALLVILYPPVLNGLINLALRVLKRQPVTLALRYGDILLVTLAWCGSWLIAGCAFFVLLLGIWPSAPLAALPVCIGIYAIAWDIGFLAFITPSGLVFREGAIVALFALAFPLPAGLSAIIAILSRFVSTLAELLCVSVAYLSGDGSKQVRALQEAEQAGQEEAQEAEKIGPVSAADEAGASEDAAVSVSGEGGQ
jgi:uncharacterized membrane protein YbhN (UPF0104 family)